MVQVRKDREIDDPERAVTACGRLPADEARRRRWPARCRLPAPRRPRTTSTAALRTPRATATAAPASLLGRPTETVRGDQELFAVAYTAELAAFVAAVAVGGPAPVTGGDAAESVRTGKR
jgi:hypothetical protein